MTQPASTTSSSKRAIPWPAAVAAAWLIPGLGHVMLGRWKRGLILFIVITATFWSGVAIGGVMTIDSRYERWWMVAQLGAGANGAAAWYRQKAVYDELRKDKTIQAFIEKKIIDANTENDRRLAAGQKTRKVPPNDIAADASGRPDSLQMAVDRHLANWPGGSIVLVNPSDNIARAYTGIIGLMNVLCVFDVLMLGLLGIRGEKNGEATP